MSLPWTPDQSLIWLRGQIKHPAKNYKDICANLVSLAAGFAGAGHPSASAWGRSVPSSKRHYGTPPRGAVVVWVTNGWGHIAFSDGGGFVICNDSHGGVSRLPISYFRNLGTPWWTKSDASLYRSAFGVNPYSGPPKIPANEIVARPGQRSPAVPKLRKALGGKSTSTYYGAVLKRRVRKWKRKHNVAPDNGIVRQHLYDRITK